MFEPTKFVPAMEDSGQCPYCGGPTVNVAFEFITCGAAWNAECFGHQVRTPVYYLPGQVQGPAVIKRRVGDFEV